jgi:branched-chain amino acid transport system substrate-binding protein
MTHDSSSHEQHNRRRGNALRMTALGICMALAVSACSSGASDGSGGSIVIGGTSDLSGPFSTNGRGLQAGLQIAIDATNKSGGIDGKKLKLEFLDDQANVSRSVANGTRLVNQNGARVIAGFLLSNTCKAVQPVAAAKPVPLICNGADSTQLGNPPDPNVFMNGLLQQRATQAMMELAAKVAKSTTRTVSMIGLGSAAIQQLQDGQKAAVVKKGWKVGASEIVPLTATDLSAQIASIVGSKPDLVFANLADATAILLVRGLRAAGVTAPIIASDSTTGVTATTTKDPALYVVAAFSAGGTPGSGYSDFLAAGKAAGIDPTKPFVNRGYEQGLIIAQALKNCNACSGKTLIDALDKLTLDTGGLTASQVAFSPTEHVAISKLYAYRFDSSTNGLALFAQDLSTGL